MENYVIIDNGLKLLTIATKLSIGKEKENICSMII